jgi:hypothetical protein
VLSAGAATQRRLASKNARIAGFAEIGLRRELHRLDAENQIYANILYRKRHPYPEKDLAGRLQQSGSRDDHVAPADR